MNEELSDRDNLRLLVRVVLDALRGLLSKQKERACDACDRSDDDSCLGTELGR